MFSKFDNRQILAVKKVAAISLMHINIAQRSVYTKSIIQHKQTIFRSATSKNHSFPFVSRVKTLSKWKFSAIFTVL